MEFKSILSQSAVTILQHRNDRDFKERIAFLNLFANMEHSLITQFGIDIAKDFTEPVFNKISDIYIGLKEFNYNEANAIFKTLTYFRNKCAHYYCDRDILAYKVKSIFRKIHNAHETLYELITDDGSITNYGILVCA